jgi:hypothetical protein
MILEPKHKNFAGPSEIKEIVKKRFNIRRHMSTPRAFKCNYFKIILNWWHSPFKGGLYKGLINEVLEPEYAVAEMAEDSEIHN